MERRAARRAGRVRRARGLEHAAARVAHCGETARAAANVPQRPEVRAAKAPALTGKIEERLKAVIAMAHCSEFPRLRTVTAYIGASYGWSKTLEEEHRALHRKLAETILAILVDGVKTGEIDRDTDLEMLLEMISSVYQRNYRTALHAGFTIEQLDERIARHLPILLNGVRP